MRCETCGNDYDKAFSVTAAGPGLSYQWQYDGTAIAGATGSSLTVPGMATTQAGTYGVVVSNAYGSATATFSVAVQVGSRLVNLSSRAYVDPADPLMAGFIMSGSGALVKTSA